jgi:hypothetical protein
MKHVEGRRALARGTPLPALQHGNRPRHQFLRLVFLHDLSLCHDANTLLDHLAQGDRWFRELSVLEAVCAILSTLSSIRVRSEKIRFLKWHRTALTEGPLGLHDRSSFHV